MNAKFSIKEVFRQLDKYSPFPLMYSFRMSEAEKALFNKQIRNSEVYYEFGMGGSTFHVLKNSNACVYSIDSSKEWIQLMKEYFYIRRMEKSRLKLFHVNIGRTKKWGFPSDNSQANLFPEYSSELFRKADKVADTILIDGRFRVACTLKAILEYYNHKNTRYIIHDFWNRPEYHIVLKYLNEIDSSDTLCVLKIKDIVDLNAVENDYNIYKYKPE